jgi:hypothetical protein
MPEGKRDASVDKYINSLPEWQRDIFQRARDLIHKAEPEITETIKRRVQPYFILNGNVCAFLAAKDHVNIFIYDPIAPDPKGIINQGHGNLTARSIQVYNGQKIDEPAFRALIKAVANNNRAGGWRRLKKPKP